MGLLDRFRRSPAQALSLSTHQIYGDWYFSDGEYLRILGMGPADMWRTQPYLRTVVTFLARNVAQLGLHAYQRVGENDRQRVRDGIGLVISRPNQHTTTFELIYGLVADLALYDRAYWLLGPDSAQYLTRLPVPWVEPGGEDLQAPEWFQVRSKDGSVAKVPAERVLYFHGWTPETLAAGSSPVMALKDILAEQVQAARYREMVWRRGGKVGAVLSRPVDAPEWGDEARKQFKADWDARFTGDGPNVGGTPLLEDGMTLGRVDFSAHEMQFVEGSRLALNTVASVYHVNPTMIGLLDNANYSNVREFRRMLYGDTLGPILAQVEDRLNAFLVPSYDSRENVYLEFNLEEKLQGSFEEQTVALQAAVGRPWMTANEARAVRNMPAVVDGEGLAVPLNLTIPPPEDAPLSATEVGQRVNAATALIRSGFEPSAALVAVGLDPITHLGLLPITIQKPSEPEAVDEEAVQAIQDTASGPSPRVKALMVKAQVTDRNIAAINDVLQRFFARQRDADKYGSGGEWQGNRWNEELAADLHEVAYQVSTTIGYAEATRLGYDRNEFDPARTVEFLKEVAKRWAENVNQTTKDQIDNQLAQEEPDVAHVYDVAIESRAPGSAQGYGTFLAGFATHEVAEQIAYNHGVEPTKTWITGANPRPEHARLDGETVALDKPFSNGLMWPGDSEGDADDTAGCNCALEINLA